MALGIAGYFAPLAAPAVRTWSHNGTPILSATQTFEGTSVQEPSVLVESGRIRLWYRGGWAGPWAIGYAECSTADDPTLAASWTKRTGPVYGNGGSGESASVALPCVKRIDGTLYLYAVKSPFGAANTDSIVGLTSADGFSWTPFAVTISRPASQDMWGNLEVWKIGATWYLLAEAQRVTATAATWQVWLYTSTDGATWSIANAGSPVTGLRRVVGAAYSCPHMLPNPLTTEYDGWFHAAQSAGVDPVATFQAYSRDGLGAAWTVTSGTPELTASVGSEGTSLGDPHPFRVGSQLYLAYDAGNPTTGPAYVFVAKAT